MESGDKGNDSPASYSGFEGYAAWRARTPNQYWLTGNTVIHRDVLGGGDTTIETKREARELASALEPLRAQLQEGVSAGFTRAGGSEAKRIGRVRHVSLDDLAYSSLYKFVTLGDLTAAAKDALTVDSFVDFKKGLRYNLAETEGIEAINVAKTVINRPRMVAPHVVLFAMMQDNEGLISSTTGERQVHLGRSIMAKAGASNVNIGLYTVAKTGAVELSSVIRHTLEGGHPTFGPSELDELGYREKISASQKTIKIETDVDTETKIPYGVWSREGSVWGIINSGKLFGNLNYLSEPVIVVELVDDREGSTKGQRLVGAARYSMQSEGAFWAKMIRYGYVLSSATGQMGAVKPDLKLEDVVAQRRVSNVNVLRVPVDGVELKKTSVEGPEYEDAVNIIDNEFPIWVVPTADGRGFTISERGKEDVVNGIRTGAAWAGGHLHREAIPTNGRVRHLHVDTREHPTYGCGVDGSYDLTRDYFRRAAELWEASGRTIRVVTINRAGHGTDYIQFPVVGEVNPWDHSIPLAEVCDSGEFLMAPDVRQIQEYLAPWRVAA